MEMLKTMIAFSAGYHCNESGEVEAWAGSEDRDMQSGREEGRKGGWNTKEKEEGEEEDRKAAGEGMGGREKEAEREENSDICSVHPWVLSYITHTIFFCLTGSDSCLLHLQPRESVSSTS